MSNERLAFVYFVLAMLFIGASFLVPQRTFADGLLYGMGLGFATANILLPSKRVYRWRDLLVTNRQTAEVME